MTVIDSPELVLPSLAVASRDEQAALEAATAQEREWYAEHPRFATNNDIALAAACGTLAFVGATENMAPIARFRNPEKNFEYPPYLLPGSLEAYRAFGTLWRHELDERGINDDRYRLAGTSYVRSESYQRLILSDPRKLASPESTHCAGGAWDTDMWDYYWMENEGSFRKVTRHDRDQTTVQAIADQLGNTPTLVAPVEHNPEVLTAAIAVADRLHYAGLVNRILEFAGTSNQCLHTAPNPEVEPAEWQALANGAILL